MQIKVGWMEKRNFMLKMYEKKWDCPELTCTVVTYWLIRVSLNHLNSLGVAGAAPFR